MKQNTCIFMLILYTLACHSNAKMIHVTVSCSNGTVQQNENKNEMFCDETKKYHYRLENPMFEGSSVISLADFEVNGRQYQLFTDKGLGMVTMTEWSNDDNVAYIKQELRIPNAYSANVIFHKGDILLLVAVYNVGPGCVSSICSESQSRLYRWNHTLMCFSDRPIQRLPTASFVHWFPEKYLDERTIILVFARCGCNTTVYYLDHDTVSSDKLLKKVEVNYTSLWDIGNNGMLIQSVRYKRTQYVLFAPTNRDNEHRPIRMFTWSGSSGMSFRNKLNASIGQYAGFSSIVYKNKAFLCTLSEASKTATIFQFMPEQSVEKQLKKVHVAHTKRNPFSMCKFFVQDHDLYVAIGSKSFVQLLQYSPAARDYVDAGKLRKASNAIDLMHFQSVDDTYLVTANYGNTNCLTYKRV